VENSATDYSVEMGVWEWQFGQATDGKIFVRKVSCPLQGYSANTSNLAGVGIDPEHFRPALDQILGIAACPTPRVQDSHLGGDPSSDNLVEDVNIDSTEESQQVVTPTR